MNSKGKKKLKQLYMCVNVVLKENVTAYITSNLNWSLATHGKIYGTLISEVLKIIICALETEMVFYHSPPPAT